VSSRISVNLYFTYRWLLLECKREFPFNDALRVLEVMWATLPIDNEPPSLSESSLPTNLPSHRTMKSIRWSSPWPSPIRRSLSCPQAFIRYRTKSCEQRKHSLSVTFGDCEQSPSGQISHDSTVFEEQEYGLHASTNVSTSTSSISRERSVENSFSLSEISEFDSNNFYLRDHPTSSKGRVLSQTSPSKSWLERLPTDNTIWLEEENSFLLFLCVSILLTHRSYLLKQKNLDEQEIAMYFDRYRRRHRAERLLIHARRLYEQYIQWARKKRMLDDLNSISASY
jgi:TBC1 domain family member 25